LLSNFQINIVKVDIQQVNNHAPGGGLCTAVKLSALALLLYRRLITDVNDYLKIKPATLIIYTKSLPVVANL
jgi:hypothetical protein